jgi:hypothetical protein
MLVDADVGGSEGHKVQEMELLRKCDVNQVNKFSVYERKWLQRLVYN